MSFAQSGERRDMSNVRCYSCQQMGHYANSSECPNYKANTNRNNESGDATNKATPQGGAGVNALMFTFSQSGKRIPKEWILLDSQSTVVIFCNPSLVENIRRAKKQDENSMQCWDKGDQPGGRFTRVRAHMVRLQGICECPETKTRERKVPCAIQQRRKGRICGDKPNGEQFKSIQSLSGLHYLDTMNPDPSKNVHTTLVVNTVAENKKNYANNDYLRALKARKLKISVGRPSTATFVDLLKRNVIANCPVTPADVEAAEHIFGTDIGSFKGKTT